MLYFCPIFQTHGHKTTTGISEVGISLTLLSVSFCSLILLDNPLTQIFHLLHGSNFCDSACFCFSFQMYFFFSPQGGGVGEGICMLCVFLSASVRTALSSPAMCVFLSCIGGISPFPLAKSSSYVVGILLSSSLNEFLSPTVCIPLLLNVFLSPRECD